MTEKEREKRRERVKKKTIVAHSIARQAAGIEDGTYQEALQIIDEAKNILEKSMKKQRAWVPPEIRDSWGVIIGMSETEASDKK